MNDFAPPAAEVSSEVDFGDAAPSLLVRIAGGVLATAGLATAVAGFQLWALVHFFDTWAWVVPYVYVPLGSAGLVLGGMLTRARVWAAVLGALVAGFSAVFGLAFTLYAIMGGFFSLLGILSVALCGLAAVLALAATPSALRSSRARAALYR